MAGLGHILPLLIFVNHCIGGKLPEDIISNKDNVTVETLNSDQIIYKFDYGLFKNKTYGIANRHSRQRRTISSRFLQDAQIDNIEVKLTWGELVSGERLGSSFILRKGNKYIEYAMLYTPRDSAFTVRGLVDATGYIGEIRVIRTNEALSNTDSIVDKDTAIVKLDTARIVSGSETNPMLNVLSNLPDSPVKLQSVSISLKLPKQRENIILEVFDLSKMSSGGKAVVHVVPDTVSLVVNDLPPQTVVKIVVRSANNGGNGKELSSINLFTGSLSLLSAPIRPSFGQPSSPRIVFSKPTNNYSRRTTVTCYVDHKPPFQGFPCKGSNVCIPLHWECDGEDDCKGGFDEIGCQGGLTSYSQQNINNYNRNSSPTKCRRNEFDCISRGVSVCLPISWKCDGRTDCSDGWDEHKDNCKDNLETTATNVGGNSQHHSSQSSNTYNHNYNYQPTRCGWNYFKCRKGGCTPLRYICDGRRDCSDGSDEHDCPDDEDTEDEDYDIFDHCDLEYEFVCSKRRRSRRCVPKPWVCDDQDDCPFGEDESEDICKPFDK